MSECEECDCEEDISILDMDPEDSCSHECHYFNPLEKELQSAKVENVQLIESLTGVKGLLNKVEAGCNVSAATLSAWPHEAIQYQVKKLQIIAGAAGAMLRLLGQFSENQEKPNG